MPTNRIAIKRLRANICNIELGGNLPKDDSPVADGFLDPKVSNIDMFCTSQALFVQEVKRCLRIDAQGNVHLAAEVVHQGLHAQSLRRS